MADSKRRGPVFWILIIGGVFMLLGLLGVGSVGFFVNRAMSEAGVTVQDFKNNPQITAVKVGAAVDPNLEIISENPDGKSIVVYNKREDRTLRMQINPDTKRMEVLDESRNVLGILGKGSQPGAEAVSLPSWIPGYPGTTARNDMTAKSAAGDSSMFTFPYSDSAEKLFDFYEQRFKAAGFTVTRVSQPEGGMLMARDAGGSRSVMVGVAGSGLVVIQVIEK